MKLWHEPRFVAGVLPAPGCDTSGLSSSTRRGTAQRVKYRQRAMVRPREYSRDDKGLVGLPFLIQNQGHGIASALTATIEFDSDTPKLRDICTEALRVNAVFGNAAGISSRLDRVVADRRIREAYARVGDGGTYVELVGASPANTVEIVVIELQCDEPLDLAVTVRLQTPERMLQQEAVHQRIRLK